MSTTRLGPQDRTATLGLLARSSFDVLVLGGGIVGAAAALDAVTRGLTVALVEARDWGSGSSARSGRLVDGGLAQLPHTRDVTNSLRERDLLLDRLAPHLVKRVPLLRPLRHGLPERLAAGGSLLLYDGLAALSGSREVVPAHRQLARRTVLRLSPALDPTHLTGGVQRYEALVDDARLALTLVRTAVGYGTVAASRVRAVQLLTERDRVVGVQAYDRETGTPVRIGARVVIAATGAWDPTLASEVVAADDQRLGVYMVVPRGRIRTSTGLSLDAAADPPITVLPWGRHWIIGPGAGTWTGRPGFPAATAEDVDALLRRINVELAADLTPGDVEGRYASSWVAQQPTAGEQPRPGLVLAASPDLTRYRVSAAHAVDVATRVLGGLHAVSTTARIPLIGADGYFAQWNQRQLLARGAGLPVAHYEHLLDRYGSLTGQLLDLLVDQPELAAPLDEAGDYLAVEALYAVTHEDARHLTDILDRRLRITTQARDGGIGIAPYVASLVRARLGWDDAETERQLAIFATRVDRA